MGDDWTWDDAQARAREEFGKAVGDVPTEGEGEGGGALDSVKDALGGAVDKAKDLADRAGDSLKGPRD